LAYSGFYEITINIYLLLAKYKSPYINPIAIHEIFGLTMNKGSEVGTV
jgi:hypothetical protein